MLGYATRATAATDVSVKQYPRRSGIILCSGDSCDLLWFLLIKVVCVVRLLVSSSESENSHNPEMDDELPILKGILNGDVKYHNARRYFLCFDVCSVLKVF